MNWLIKYLADEARTRMQAGNHRHVYVLGFPDQDIVYEPFPPMKWYHRLAIKLEAIRGVSGFVRITGGRKKLRAKAVSKRFGP